MNFTKKKNEIINKTVVRIKKKKKAKICYIFKEKFENEYCKLQITVIVNGNTELLAIAYVIQNIAYLKKFL